LQTPLAQALVRPEHGPQAAPPVPHVAAPWLAVVTQVPALQQPVGQLVASHTQPPLTHRWPAAHTAPVPQAQAPLAQRSALAPHVAQLLPPLPQLAAVAGATQVLPLQHPVGQLAALHTHAPPTQTWPVPQAALLPHLHVPAAQLSALGAVQLEQAAPLVPHVAAADARQTPALQQPLGQLVASQPAQAFKPVQAPGHTWQAMPPVPHEAAVSPVMQVPFAAQHPLGQLAGLHTHAPATHC
jgi:hypothetical protein